MAPSALMSQSGCKGKHIFYSCKSLGIFFHFFVAWGGFGVVELPCCGGCIVVRPSCCVVGRVVGLLLCALGGAPTRPARSTFRSSLPDFRIATFRAYFRRVNFAPRLPQCSVLAWGCVGGLCGVLKIAGIRIDTRDQNG